MPKPWLLWPDCSRTTDAAQAAARALGSIGTPEAAKALEDALPGASGSDQLAICEGLLRCAEALAADGQSAASQAIYDRLRGLTDAPPQVRTAALRGAVLARGKDGVPLLVEAIRGPDYVLAAAAARTAMESPSPEISDALVAELPKVPAERQGLLMLALANRGDSRILPTVLKAAQSSDEQLRILAFRALKRVGDASCVPALLDAAADGGDEVSQAAMRFARKPARQVRRRSGRVATVSGPGKDADGAHRVGRPAAYSRGSSCAVAGCR